MAEEGEVMDGAPPQEAPPQEAPALEDPAAPPAAPDAAPPAPPANPTGAADKKRRLDEGGAAPVYTRDQITAAYESLLGPMDKNTIVELLANITDAYADVFEMVKDKANESIEHRKLFVRGLSWETGVDALRTAFEAFGEVTEVAIIEDKHTGRSKGYGFVTFARMEHAAAALAEPEKEIDGRATHCNLASKPSDRAAERFEERGVDRMPGGGFGRGGPAASFGDRFGGGGDRFGGGGGGGNPYGSRSNATGPSIGDKKLRKLFLRGLSWNTTSDMLLREFMAFGEIEEAVVAFDRGTSKSKGYGFVTFRTPESTALVAQQPSRYIDGRQVTIAYAEPSLNQPGAVAAAGGSTATPTPGFAGGAAGMMPSGGYGGMPMGGMGMGGMPMGGMGMGGMPMGGMSGMPSGGYGNMHGGMGMGGFPPSH